MKNLVPILVVLVMLMGCNSSDNEFIEPKDIGSSTKLSLPTGLATDSVDNLYVFDSGKHRVLKFDNAGNFLAEWGRHGSGEGEFNCFEDRGTICGIVVDPQNNIYTVDKGNYRIQKFDSEGNFLIAWGNQGTGDGQFVRPIYVAVDLQGNVFVTDDRNPVIQKFDSNGQFLLKWGSLGTAEGQFRHATGIAIDSQGHVYVSDYENERIQKFDNNGQFIMSWKTGAGTKSGVPEAIAIDSNDRIYVTDSELKQIEIFNSDGESLGVIKLRSAGLLDQVSPYGIAIDSGGNIFVSDRKNNRVFKYAAPVW